MDKVFLQDYIRYGLELAEYHLLESYDGVKDKTDETDRVFLESVQVSFLFAFSLSRSPVFFVFHVFVFCFNFVSLSVWQCGEMDFWSGDGKLSERCVLIFVCVQSVIDICLCLVCD